MTARLLTINTGSSSLKSAVYDRDSLVAPLASALISRISLEGCRLRVSDGSGTSILDETVKVSDHTSALALWIEWLRSHDLDKDIAGAGHRIVHGGRRYTQPQFITGELISALEELVQLDPEHIPAAIAAIQAAGKALHGVPQVACFDTAFHRHMPLVAQQYALPRRYTDDGVIRFGFHGLSYEYVMEELTALDPDAASARVVIAHLGNGASMAAVRDGVSVDTTMGFTPAGGLVMSSRSGDLDPGVLVHLLRSGGLSAEALSQLINSESGLLGVSETTGDMADLLELEHSDQRAAEAVDLFCYQAKKYLGALAAALGGINTLVFTGGIGENSPVVRQRICEGLGFLGIELHARLNAENRGVVSRPGSRICVRVIKTNEELMIARHVARLLSQGGTRVPV